MNTTVLLVRRFLADYTRNGPNLVLLAVIPVVFVVVAAPPLADAARLLGGTGGGPALQTVTAGWAAALLTAVAMYFQISAARTTDRRLTLAGLGRVRLASARLAAGAALAIMATLVAVLALTIRGQLDNPWRVAAGTAMFAAVYLGLGAAVGALAPNAVNGTVILMFIWILDVFFGPTLSGSESPVLRLLPTHFISLWTVALPSEHGGPGELALSLGWVVAAVALALWVIARSTATGRARQTRDTGPLPGYGGTRVMIDGALTSGFDEAISLAVGLSWITALLLAATVLLRSIAGSSVPESSSQVRLPSRAGMSNRRGVRPLPVAHATRENRKR